MVRKYGVDTDEFDKESCEAAEDIVKQQIAEDWTYEELQSRYETLKAVTLKNLPNLWPGLEFALSVKTIINIKGIDLPFIGIILGPASSMKTVAVDLFKGYKHTFYTDHFSPRSLVSHNSGMTEKQLRKIDLLPKIRNKNFLTPELSPMFSIKDDDLNHVIGLLTRIADGDGYQSDSGAQGHRGYDGKMMFTWVGETVDIPYKVHKLLSTLGPKLYFFRLPRVEKTEDEYFDRKDDDFHIKKQRVKAALFEYLYYFEMNPHIIIEEEQDVESIIWNGHNDDKDESGKDFDEDGMLPKVQMHQEGDDELAHRIIIRLALMLAHLRATVPVWDTSGTQGSDYAYTFANIEDPSRAMTQMRNLARGHALSQGRTTVTMDDIPVVIHTVLSTATTERVRLFELLIENKGVLTTSIICDSLNTSPPTARRTMTELKATKLVDDITEKEPYNAEMKIRLKSKFAWFISDEFKTLKEKCPPHTHAKIESVGTNEDNVSNAECVPYYFRNDSVRGGIFSFSPPNGDINGPYSCPYCGGRFTTSDLYERHVVKGHKGWTAYPGPPDLERYRQLHNDKRSKLADMAAANISGNGVMFGNGNGQEKDGVNLG